MALRSVGGLLARPDAGITYFKKMETKRKFIHILLRESEKDGTKTEMKIMYSIFEKITFGAVALGVTLLILFMNSTKDIQLGSALSETDSVVSQEVATVSDEAVEPEVGSTVDVVTEVVSEDQMYTETIVFDDWRDGDVVGWEHAGETRFLPRVGGFRIL